MERAKKLQNDHADQQIEVEGSEIQSGSEAQDGMGDLRGQNQPALEQGLQNYEQNNLLNVQGQYDPDQYSKLPVSSDVKELFKVIGRYTPIMSEIQPKLKAFIPDYVPAIGEVDAFLKMPRPDGEPENLGLYVVDEPALNMSDKAKIELIMSNNNLIYKGGHKTMKIHSIESAEKDPKKISQWIESVTDIHKKKQPPSVSYSKNMPDINHLMQQWNPQFEQALNQISVPHEDIDLSLEDYSSIACNLADIPVHRDSGDSCVIESLHVLFTLFHEFSTNEHFKKEDDREYVH